MKKRPNILMVMTDHQRFDTKNMVQCGREVTPNLNRLAAEGVDFLRAYDTCPLCVPARTAIATGIYPTANGVVYNDWQGATAQQWEPLHRSLKKAGYRVGHVGVDHIRVKPPMKDQQLDLFVTQQDYIEWASSLGIEMARRSEQLREVEEEINGGYLRCTYSGHVTGTWGRPKEQFKDMYFGRKALEFLDEPAGEEKPFALFVYLWAPHPPLTVPEPFSYLYSPEEIKLPDNVGVPAQGEPYLRRRSVPAQLAQDVTMDEWRRTWAAHLGLTSMADEILGQLLDKLKQTGRYEDTCVIFTVDHGDHLGQHAMYQKMEMYEEAVHVPLVIHAPGVKSGRVESVVSHLDIRPTICELTGMEPVVGVAGEKCRRSGGRSLGPLMRGEKEDGDRIVYCQYSGNPGYGTIRRAAITGRYKFVIDSSCQCELYDLKEDPHEMRNVAGDAAYAEPLQYLYRACRQYHQENGDYFPWKISL